MNGPALTAVGIVSAGENSLDEHVDRVCIVGPVGPASAVVGMWGVHVVAPSRLLLAIKNDG
jgi:hypothetical protein